MAVVLTSDPIVSEQMVLEMLNLSGDKARAYINAVSGLFMQYTSRSRITKGDVTDKQVAPPPHYPVLWLRATPIDEITSVKVYRYGDLVDTLTSDEYTLNEETGRMVLEVNVAGYYHPEQVIHVAYSGGWEDVPGNIQHSALEMVRLQKQRLEGRVGVTSESREGYAATYDPAAVPQSIADIWRAYRVYS